MKNSFKKFKKGPLITAVIFLTISVFVFTFLYKEINKNYDITKERETELALEAFKKEETKSFDRILKTIENEINLLNNHFIKTADVAIFLDATENLASLIGATAEVTQVDVASDNSSLSVGMKVEGSFEALYKFIRLLENSSYQLEITSMNMQKIGTVIASDITEGVKIDETVKWSGVFQVKLLSFIP